MKVEVETGDIYEPKADSRGRLSLPASEFKNKRWRIAVIEQVEE